MQTQIGMGFESIDEEAEMLMGDEAYEEMLIERQASITRQQSSGDSQIARDVETQNRKNMALKQRRLAELKKYQKHCKNHCNHDKKRSYSPELCKSREELDFKEETLNRNKTDMPKTSDLNMKLDTDDESAHNQKAEEKEKPHLLQVYQGRQADEGASLLDRLLFRYSQPFIYASGVGDIELEQLGNIDPEQAIAKVAPGIEENYAYYATKNPNSKANLFWAWVWTFRWQIFSMILIKMLFLVPDMADPLLVKEIVGVFAPNEDTESAELDLQYSFTIAALYVSKNLFRSLAQRHMDSKMAKLNQQSAQSIKYWLFKKSIKISPSSNIQYGQGELTNIVEHGPYVMHEFTWRLIYQLFMPVEVVLNLLQLFYITGYSTFAGLMVFGFSYLFDRQAHLFLDSMRNPVLQETRDKKERKLNEIFTHAKTLKLFGLQDRFKTDLNDLREEEDQLDQTSGLLDTVVWNINGIVRSLIPTSIFMAYILYTGKVDLGMYMAASMLISRIQWPIKELFEFKNLYKRLYRRIYRLQKVIHLEEVQANTVEQLPVESEIAIHLKGNFSWKLGEKENEEEELKKTGNEKEDKKIEEDDKSISDDSSYFEVSDDEENKDKSDLGKDDSTQPSLEAGEGSVKSKDETTHEGKKDEAKKAEKKKSKKIGEILTLKDINLEIKRGEFVLIIGKIGSGKTSLLQALLNEMTYIPENEVTNAGGLEGELTDDQQNEMRKRIYQDSGEFEGGRPIKLQGTTTYVEQSAWIQNLTVRDNILFGKEFDVKRYVQTISACQLESDLENFAAGDMTEIGERGINLSGGQKARVSLARAVYRNPDIILMDDPVSALDAIVKRKVFKQVFNGMLKGRTRVLVTHATDFIPLADKVVFMKDGKIEAVGTPDELKDHEYLQELAEIAEKNQEEATKQTKDQAVGEKSAKILDMINSNEKNEEVLLAQKLERALKLSKERKDQEKLLSMTDAEAKQKLRTFIGNRSLADCTEVGALFSDEKDNKRAKDAKIDFTVLKQTFVLMGGLFTIGCFISSFFINQIVTTFGTFYDKNFYASEQNQQEALWTYIRNCLIIQLVDMLIDLLRQVIEKKKSKIVLSKIYSQMLNRMVNAPVNEFFDITPIDKIISRFHTSIDCFQHRMVNVMASMFRQISDVAIKTGIMFAVSGWLGALTAFLAYSMIKTAVSQEAMHNSSLPVQREIWKKYNVSAYQTEQGNPLIRCFGQQEHFHKRKAECIDKLQVLHKCKNDAWQHMLITRTTLESFFLALSCVILIRQRGKVSPVILTTAFNQILNISWVSGVVWEFRQFVKALDDAKWAIKIQEICPQEQSCHTQEINSEWPKEGNVEFQDVKLKYRSHLPDVLKSLKFSVEGGHKIGIVGRTAAGKSTMGLALTRIIELTAGAIEVDGVDISKVDIQALRDKITVVPQDPVMFEGTIKFNLDPTNEHSDERIQELLQDAGVWDVIKKLSKDKAKAAHKHRKQIRKNIRLNKKKSIFQGLNLFTSAGDLYALQKSQGKEESNKGVFLKVENNGSDFSMGERQLLCICRAILRKNKLVIFDEATSNIDIVTEKMIQSLVKEHFKEATMFTIAHRLNTIINSDEILLLANGQKVEMDTPANLLANPLSRFSQFINEVKQAEE